MHGQEQQQRQPQHLEHQRELQGYPVPNSTVKFIRRLVHMAGSRFQGYLTRRPFVSGQIQKVACKTPIFDGGCCPTLPLIKEYTEITFIHKWGQKSWIVEFNGPLINSRRKHVELRSEEEVQRKVPNTAYHLMKPGAKYQLEGLHRKGYSIARNVIGLYRGIGEDQEHLTVRYGIKSVTDLLPIQGHESSQSWCRGYGHGTVEAKTYAHNGTMLDSYAQAACMSNIQNMEIPILAPRELFVRAGDELTLNMEASIELNSDSKHQDCDERTRYPRPLFTKNGPIIIDFQSESSLRILNQSGDSFYVPRLGVITSVMNTRQSYIEALYDDYVVSGYEANWQRSQTKQ